MLGIVHAETSTGAWQPIEELGKLCHEFDTLLRGRRGDVARLHAGGARRLGQSTRSTAARKRAWAVRRACRRCRSARAASTRSASARRKVQSWYFDLTMVPTYWGEDRAYHHTAPITMIYALREGLRMVLEEGLQARWDRHCAITWR